MKLIKDGNPTVSIDHILFIRYKMFNEEERSQCNVVRL